MVAIDRKGQGIGTALIKAVEEKAKSLGAHKIWLETGTTWKSKNFYEKNGYFVRTIMPNHTGNQDFVLLDKML
jgi:GNAT superfamily N-acetyltransferase